ncbi:MAG: Asp-tRNA(Asn)/Glu-tRNA(Gln) amidotransferase subunit GatA [Limnochordia bacterium]|nr:Asp-tRNA(Asn)/Glu-tRNA(Gln) amidotransferase subunit GatA [Limnochordia bacterium]
MKLCNLPAHRLIEMLSTKEISAEELAQDLLRNIQAREDQVKAYITIDDAENILAKAKAADAKRDGASEPFLGLPMAIKDNICTTELPTTCASKMLEDYHSPFAATVCEKLEQAGLIFVGKTNLDEFGMGSSTENSAFYPTHNPVDPTRVPGGSSGGSAAAVAAGEAIWALGTDAGGSVRQPAAFCGVVGLKPTYGRLSRYGLISFAPSFDHIGLLTRDVADCALLLRLLAGHDPLDATSSRSKVADYPNALGKEIAGLTVGVPAEFLQSNLQGEIKGAIHDAIQALKDAGAVVQEISLPHLGHGPSAYYALSCAEASSNLGRFDGVRYGLRDESAQDVTTMFKNTRRQGFGPEVKRRILTGAMVLVKERREECYLKAVKVRQLIKEDFHRVLDDVDLILGPTTPTTAFKLGTTNLDPALVYDADRFTVAANLAGVPAMNLPFGFDGAGLPIGLQLIGRPFGEETLFQVGSFLEECAGSGKNI